MSSEQFLVSGTPAGLFWESQRGVGIAPDQLSNSGEKTTMSAGSGEQALRCRNEQGVVSTQQGRQRRRSRGLLIQGVNVFSYKKVYKRVGAKTFFNFWTFLG